MLVASTNDLHRRGSASAAPAANIAPISTWSQPSEAERHRTALESWIEAQGLVATGEPVWARYNAPFTPWFLRRNEILIPIDGGG